ncbi:hypothetical protein THAOC_22902 [Thalassiosira oceanica]|uniref:Uncharacterized protein n=1 Tax=Thalassiosira oceanica TaxID=159749 RepID=K0RVU2_THAOC|nr:hypothetical protein THAOC_22902 [Thalassiosira oceanica]|eukprot:EJK57090.1 hypothetical protein THAOC_22902 [Thalassiosira oceanica]
MSTASPSDRKGNSVSISRWYPVPVDCSPPGCSRRIRRRIGGGLACLAKPRLWGGSGWLRGRTNIAGRSGSPMSSYGGGWPRGRVRPTLGPVSGVLLDVALLAGSAGWTSWTDAVPDSNTMYEEERSAVRDTKRSNGGGGVVMSTFHFLLSQNDLPADENNVKLTDNLAKSPSHKLAKWLVEEVALKRFSQKFLYAVMGKRLKPGKKYKHRKSGRDVLIRYGGDSTNQTRVTFDGLRKRKKSILVNCSLAFRDREDGAGRLALLTIEARTENKMPCDSTLEAEVIGGNQSNTKSNNECSKKTKVARKKVPVGTNVWLAKSGCLQTRSLFATSPAT